jgi:RNA polymerase sigma-70 factor (ECF subfamily)
MHTPTIASFDTLVDKHSHEIFVYLWRMIGDPQDSEDALQETFLRAFRNFPQLETHLNLRAWLYKIATNVAYTHLKRRSRQAARITDLTDRPHIASPDDPVKRDLLEAALQAIEKLPHKQQSALLMRNCQGLSYEEIGTALDCSPGAARANVYQALKKLRDQLSEK